MKLQNQGFTLIELIITLALAAVVVGLAAPSIGHMIKENAVISINNEIVADVQYTRSEAIKRNQWVSICASNADQTACVAGSNWANGWIVFTDANQSGALDVGEVIVREHAGKTTDQMTIVTANGNVANHISYQGNGFPIVVGGASPNGEILICGDGTVQYSRKIKINQTGRVQSVGESDACS